MHIITATKENLQQIAPLFDQYRIFYKQSSDIHAATQFLKQRLENNDSKIFLALSNQGIAVGFTQLYPCFSSVSMQKLYILNDLFVQENFRQQGVGEALLRYAQNYAECKVAKSVLLETAKDNHANNLYQRLGWHIDDCVNHYTWEVRST